MQLEPEAFAETVNGLEDLVALRNQLAHHSMERFDPLEPPELRRRRRLPGAQLHAQVDRHLLELLEWARYADKARAHGERPGDRCPPGAPRTARALPSPSS